MRKKLIPLWFLYTTFVGRVFGQLLVSLDMAPWLPPFKQWQSGVIPYPALVALQFVILGLFAKAAVDVTRQAGLFAYITPKFRDALRIFALLYGCLMVARYLIVQIWFPNLTQIAPLIPTVFHIVLASFLLLLSVCAAIREPSTT